jgi:hypothetical protein
MEVEHHFARLQQRCALGSGRTQSDASTPVLQRFPCKDGDGRFFNAMA